MPSGVQVASLFGVLNLTDNLSPGLETAKTNLTSFGDSVGQKMKSAGESITNLGVGMTLLGAPFLALAVGAVRAASESQLALAQLDSVLESTGGKAGVTRDTITGMAGALQQTTRYSDEATVAAGAMLLTFTNIGADVFPDALTAVLDLSTAMGQDTKSSAIQLGKALNDPINGITSLTRVGVTFTDAQKEQIAALVASGDTMGAQKIILQELQAEFGGSAVAAGQTFPGQLDILKNKFGEVQEQIGTAIIPILSDLMDTFSDLALGLQNADPATRQTIVNFILIGAAFAIAGPIIAGVGAAITVLSGAVAFLLSPAGLLILAIAGIVFALNSLYPGGLAQLMLDASVAAAQLGAIISAVLGAAIQWVKDRIAELITTIQDFIAKIQDAKDALVGGLTGGNASATAMSGFEGAAAASQAFLNNTNAGAAMGGHALGTPFVPTTGMYMLHRGEAVVPANEASQGGGNMMFTGNITVVANDPKAFEQQLKRRYRARGNY